MPFFLQIFVTHNGVNTMDYLLANLALSRANLIVSYLTVCIYLLVLFWLLRYFNFFVLLIFLLFRGFETGTG